MPPSAQSTASKSTLNPNWPQYACSLTILVALLAATIRYLAIGTFASFVQVKGSTSRISSSLVLTSGCCFPTDWDDRLHCKALINSGQWMDNDLKVWQPEGTFHVSFPCPRRLLCSLPDLLALWPPFAFSSGCMTHQYAPKLISTCMPNRRIVFVGDSVTRELFYALATAADPTAPSAPSEDGLKHQDVHWSVAGGGPELQFFWDPYVHQSSFNLII